ncbi:MAG: hypothetical protein AAF337_11520 [Pseudomonadota bacterium]
MAKKKTLPAASTIFKAAFDRIDADGPKSFAVDLVADDLNVEPGLLAPMFNDLSSLASAFGRFVDQSVAAEVGDVAGGTDEPAVDRLFEVLMARFDAIQPYRAGLIALGKEAPREPQLLSEFACIVPNSMQEMLSLAGLLAKRPKRGLQVVGLTALWLRCVRVWMKDESEDMAKTMATLDKSLKDASSIARRLF